MYTPANIIYIPHQLFASCPPKPLIWITKSRQLGIVGYVLWLQQLQRYQLSEYLGFLVMEGFFAMGCTFPRETTRSESGLTSQR